MNSRYTLLIVLCFYCPIQAADPSQLVPRSKDLTLPIESSFIKAPLSPAQSTELSVYLSQEKVTSLALPSALSYMTGAMKNPYMLLVATTGASMAYIMMNPGTVRAHDVPRLLGIQEEQLNSFAQTAITGLVSGVGAHMGAGMVTAVENVTSYIKPVLLAGTVLGLTVLNTTNPSADHPYLAQMMNTLLLGALPNFVDGTLAKKMKNLLPFQAKKPHDLLTAPKDAKKIIAKKSERKAWEKRMNTLYETVTSDYLIAFVSFGTVITLQTVQEGTLSQVDQSLTMATLIGATQLLQSSVAYEYGRRFSGNLCQTVASGVSKALDFSSTAVHSCTSALSSWWSGGSSAEE